MFNNCKKVLYRQCCLVVRALCYQVMDSGFESSYLIINVFSFPHFFPFLLFYLFLYFHICFFSVSFLYAVQTCTSWGGHIGLSA